MNDTKIPGIKWSDKPGEQHEFNWHEIESWLIYNSPIYYRAYDMALHRGKGTELEQLKLAVAYFAIQNQEQFEQILKMKMAEPIVFSAPRNMVFRPSIWKRIWCLIRTGEWIS